MIIKYYSRKILILKIFIIKLQNKANASERNSINAKNNINKDANNTNNLKSLGNILNKINSSSNNQGGTKSTTLNQSKNTSYLNDRSVKESPIKTNKSVDNIIVPPKKFKKRILYMSDITKVGFSGQSNKKHNQDILFIYKNFNNDPNAIYMAVW